MSDWHAEPLPFAKIVLAYRIRAIFYPYFAMLVKTIRVLNVLVEARKVKKKNESFLQLFVSLLLKRAALTMSSWFVIAYCQAASVRMLNPGDS
jgi:hypothetical protein